MFEITVSNLHKNANIANFILVVTLEICEYCFY